MSEPVAEAVILLAGSGSRLREAGENRLKPMLPFLGRPLISHTLAALTDAGIKTIYAVIGFEGRALRTSVEPLVSSKLNVRWLENREWQKQNGISVLAAAPHVTGPFLLVMGDHLFEPSTLRRLRHAPINLGESVLAVDRRPAPAAVVAEATKVQLDGGYVRAIGKTLTRHDALDTGLFVCDPSLFAALEESVNEGDTTLTGGIRRLAARGVMRAIDLVDTPWFDIDTLEDLEAAESTLQTGEQAEVA